jgi:hypothetical protein
MDWTPHISGLAFRAINAFEQVHHTMNPQSHTLKQPGKDSG